jgi:hypothetical protein
MLLVVFVVKVLKFVGSSWKILREKEKSKKAAAELELPS